MKKFKKLIVIVLSLFLVVGCSMGMNKASDAVKKYLNNYKDLQSDVSSQLDDLVDKEDLNDSQKKTYRNVLERQYKDMKYEITDEKYDGDEAIVTAKITVYDYYKIQQDIAQYLKEHREEFYKDDVYDEDAYIDYKLDKMNKYDKTVTYTINFNVEKQNNKWVVKDLKESDLEKIHGIYDYSND